MAVTHKIAEVCTWGTSELGALTVGTIYSFERRDTCKPVEITDENGELSSLVLTDRRTEISLEILSTASAAAPTTGGTITIDSVAYIIRDSEIMWTAGQARKFRVTAWTNQDFPAPFKEDQDSPATP